jgi:hypothetical protein
VEALLLKSSRIALTQLRGSQTAAEIVLAWWLELQVVKIMNFARPSTPAKDSSGGPDWKPSQLEKYAYSADGRCDAFGRGDLVSSDVERLIRCFGGYRIGDRWRYC